MVAATDARTDSLTDERLQLALDAGGMGTWSYDLATGSQTWDRRQYALFGLSPEVQPTRDLFMSMVLEEDREAVTFTPALLKPGVRYESQFRIRRPDGTTRWLMAHSLTRADATGHPIEVVGVNWDITAQKEAEARLAQSVQHLELALDAGRMGTWRYDLATGKQEWNARQFELLGLPPDAEPSRSTFISVVLPEDADRIAFSPENLRSGHFHDSEFRVRLPDGQIRWIAARSFARHDSEGRAIERIGVNWDTTERKQAELAALDAERRLALAAEAARLGIWDWNIETGAFYYSPRAREIYGFQPDEVITYDRLQARTLPEDYRQIEPIVARALDPAVRGYELYRYRITRADNGEERWLLAHGGAVFEERGGRAQPVRFTGTLQDITDEIWTQQALVDEQTRLQLALAAGELAVWELDVQTNTIKSSPELNRLYRFPEDSTPALEDFLRLYDPEELERVQATTAAALAGGDSAIKFEARHVWPDGQIKWISVRAQVFSEDGRPRRVLGVAMDATERRLSEERLRTTARELQHRVKNTLSVVQSIATQTFRSAPTKEAGVAAFGARLRALGRATDLLTNGNWQQVRLGEVVSEVLQPHRDQLHDRFDVSGEEIDIDSRHAVSLALALHELSTNAIKYGALSNETGRVDLRWRQDGAAVVLDWAESGGPPILAPPVSTGFGTKLLTRGLFDLSEGGVQIDYLPDGVRCRMVIGGLPSAGDAPAK
jgi:PAS domain S-box-containing protein